MAVFTSFWSGERVRVYGDAPRRLDAITRASSYRDAVNAPVTDPAGDPVDPHELPLAHLGRPLEGGGPQDGDRRPTHVRSIVIAASLVVVVGMIAGVAVFNNSAPELGRGAVTARDAAVEYVRSINTGDTTSAAKIACDSFTDDAAAAAGSGRDPGISFVLRSVRERSKTGAVAMISERTALPGGQTSSRAASVDVVRSGGRWLVCGRR
jgi:hypothetical protein